MGYSRAARVKGVLGDCWLLSAMSVIAQNEAVMSRMFPIVRPDLGLYVVQFFK